MLFLCNQMVRISPVGRLIIRPRLGRTKGFKNGTCYWLICHCEPRGWDWLVKCQYSVNGLESCLVSPHHHMTKIVTNNIKPQPDFSTQRVFLKIQFLHIPLYVAFCVSRNSSRANQHNILDPSNHWQSNYFIATTVADFCPGCWELDLATDRMQSGEWPLHVQEANQRLCPSLPQ